MPKKKWSRIITSETDTSGDEALPSYRPSTSAKSQPKSARPLLVQQMEQEVTGAAGSADEEDIDADLEEENNDAEPVEEENNDDELMEENNADDHEDQQHDHAEDDQPAAAVEPQNAAAPDPIK